MSCGHCTSKVEDGLMKKVGVVSASANLKEKKVTVNAGLTITEKEFFEIIEKAGYRLINVEKTKK